MTTVAIVGAGTIGGATAEALASSRLVGRVVLIDAAAEAAAGKALDLQQSGAISLSHVRFEGTSDWSRLVGCTVCIVADRFAPRGGEWRDDEGLAMLSRAVPYLGDAPIVLAGTAQATLLARAVVEAGVAHRRLIGSATVAFASSVSAIVAMEAGCSPGDVALTVLGTPPAGFVVPWSGASIAGRSLSSVLTPPQLNRVEGRAARLWPPGPYGLGAAAAQVVDAVLDQGRRSLPVLAWLTGEFGLRNRAGIVHATFGRHGIAGTYAPELTGAERTRLLTALDG